MQAKEAILQRRSCRSFQGKPIPAKLIEELIEYAGMAPTARNVQPWEFIAVTNRQTLKKIGFLADNGRFIADAACCIAVFCKDTKYYLEDGCAATMNILIGAISLGLGACWVAGDKKPYCQEIANLLNLPSDFKLVSLIALGYPQEDPSMPAKRVAKEILHWEKF